MKETNIIVCVDCSYGISKNRTIPWNVKEDLENFKKITSNCETHKRNVLIVGKNTFESLPKSLQMSHDKHRLTIQVSRSSSNTIDKVIEDCNKDENIDKIFICGGSDIYQYAINNLQIDAVYMTKLKNSFDCDNSIDFHSVLNTNFKIRSYLNNNTFEYFEYVPLLQEELYLNLLKNVLYNGKYSLDRTNTGTIRLFGERLEFSLDRFPLLTTKKVYWRGIVHELLWFLKGHTNVKLLQNESVHIWDGNTSREYLDSIGLLDRNVGDAGPIYGYQWRKWNADYSQPDSKGVDQLQECIDLIKNNPTSRRILFTAWNPEQLNLMALPPCHIMCQFFVDGNLLSCQMYQRSVDCFLGLPFNIASYALLTYIIAHITGKTPHRLILVLGDTHIYSNHIEQVKQQITRIPYDFPTIAFKRQVKNIDDFVADDIRLLNYDSHPTIKAKMAV
tara:strand:- start:157 stop:1494 length:1338 start_codon:yes stop_codon:yes gene_type:complete